MSTPIIRKKDTGQAGNPGQFAHTVHGEPTITLGATEHEELRGTISHHVAPVIGWARSDAGNRAKQDDLLEKLERRAALAGQEIAKTMTGDRADWAAKVITGRLGRIVRLLAQTKDKEGDYVLNQSSEDYNFQMDELADIFTREAEAEGPLPASGMPVLGNPEDGYVNRLDEDGTLDLQVRLVDRLPQDSDDGTAAIITYGVWATTERHYTSGKLHDGSGDTPSERLKDVMGTTTLTRGFIRKHSGWLTPQDSPDGQPAQEEVFARDEPNRTLVSSRSAGDVVTRWMADGQKQDPATGVPALTITNPDGHRTEILAPFGRVQDLPDGTPSERSWTPSGDLSLEIRRYNEHLWDSDSGEPAYRRWDADGTLVKELHFEQSKERTRHNPEAPRRAETAYYARTEPIPRFEG